VFLEELRSQSYSDGRTDGRAQTITISLRRFAAADKKGIRVEYIRLEIAEFKRMGGRH
jgi:transcriptional regulator